MPDDPIVESVRKVREAHAAKFNNNLDAIFADLKSQERASGRDFGSYPPRIPQLVEAAEDLEAQQPNKPMQPTGSAGG